MIDQPQERTGSTWFARYRGIAGFAPWMIVSAGLAFGKVILLGHLLKPHEFGAYSFVVTLIQYVVPIASLGLVEGLSQRVPFLLGNRQIDQSRELRSSCLAGLGLAITIAAVMVAGASLAWFATMGSWPWMTWLGFLEGTAYVLFSFVVRDVRNHLRTSTFALLLFLRSLADLGITGTAAWYWGAQGALLAETCILAAVALFAAWRFVPSMGTRVVFRSAEFRCMLTQGLGVAGLGLLANTELLGDRLVLGTLLPAADYAVYAVHGIIVVAGINVLSIVTQYALPHLLHSYGKNSDANETLNQVRQLHRRLLIVVAPLLPVVCVSASWLAAKWYTSYTIRPEIMWLLGAGVAVEVINVFPLGILAIGEPWRLVRMRLGSSAFVVAGNLLLFYWTRNLIWFAAMFLAGRLAFFAWCLWDARAARSRNEVATTWRLREAA